MINNQNDLLALVERCLKVEAVAIDTEFVWERTYYPRLGVVQIGLPDGDCFLIDVPAIKDMSPLGRLLADSSVVKILHDAQQDLIILRRATGQVPINIFDSRLVAGFAGLTSTISLRDLLREVMDVHLSKTETRTDWLKRPLSERQITYAIDDVRYLPTVRERLLSSVVEFKREEWVKEELALYDIPSLYDEKDPFVQYQRLKGTGRLAPMDFAVLRELAAWREKEAMRHDRPRGHILKDEVIVALAKRSPTSVADLKGVKGFFDKEARLYGAGVIKAVERGRACDEDDYPLPPAHHSRDEALSTRVDLVLAYIKGKCLSCDIDISLVATRADVTSLLAKGSEAGASGHRLLSGWRREFVGEELVQLMSGRLKIMLNPDTGLPQLVADD